MLEVASRPPYDGPVNVMTIVPSKYQQALYQAVERGEKAIVVSAVAGSGKTTSLTSLLEYIPADKSVLYLTFGKDANTHLSAKIEQKTLELSTSGVRRFSDMPQVDCRTVHSLGNGALASARIKGDPSKGGNKYLKIARELISAEAARLLSEGRDEAAAKFNYQLGQNLKKLVEMVRLTLSLPLEKYLKQLIKRFEIDILPEDEDVWLFVRAAVPVILARGIELAKFAGEIDFTDMIWLPSSQALNLQPKQYDVVLIDEAQDLSPCQRELALRACKPNGQKIFVGDRCQSIYAFAGASLRSIDEIIEATGAIELPLSICYRCPQVVIEEAKSVGADYERIEAAPDAPLGTLEYLTPDKVGSTVQSGDLILCRLTAPLVSKCLELLRDGKRANVRGRDLGAQFTTMIEQIQKFASNLSESEVFFKLVETVRAYERRQVEILSMNLDENEMKIATLEDKVETLLALYEAYQARFQGEASVWANDHRGNLTDFLSYIKGFFAEDPGAQIILSTGHRAKGLEYPRVFILDYDKLPHPRAKTPEALKQEWNLQYVMVTRAQQALFLVGNYREPEPTLFDDLPVEAAVQLLAPLVDDPFWDMIAPIVEEQQVEEPRRRGRTSGEPTKKKDFRLPVNLLEALKAVADESGMNDTALIIELLKSDPRIQQKLHVMTEKKEQVKV